MTKIKNMKLENKLILSIVVVILLLCTVFASFSAMAWSVGEIRGELWTKGGYNTVSNTDILTSNALVYYASSGVWGPECQAQVKENARLIKTPNQVGSYCPAALKFYTEAENYGNIVDARMKLVDPTGQRTDAAMTKFSSLAGEVFAILVGFGCLTAILVFTIIFMKLAWMPSHAIERRKIMIDIATSGASIMLLGNVWLVLSLFQSCFNRFWQTFAVYSKDWRTVANMVLVEYKGFITGFSGIATLLVLGMFVVNFVGLALDGGSNKRSEKIQNILHCAIAAAGLGSVTLVVGFFWNMFS